MTSHRTIYLVVGGVMFALLVVMLVTWNYNRSNEEALAKAQQLITAFEKAGLRTPGQRRGGRQSSGHRRRHRLQLR